MILEHQRIVLTADLPADGLVAGDVGTIVHAYVDGWAYEVEFAALDGHTITVATVEASQLRPVGPSDVTHARSVTAA